MQVDTTVIGFVVTWLGIFFSGGVIYGRLTTKIEKNTKDIDEIGKHFVDQQGEPRLVSFAAHDHICQRANESISVELRHITSAIATHSQAVADCGKQVASLTVAVAVLEEKSENERL